MNEELLKQVTEIIKGTKDFVVSQAPDIVRQYLNYYTHLYLFGLVAFGVFLITGTALLAYGLRDGYNRDGAIVLGAIIFTISLIATICTGINYYEITTAPKVFLLEYLHVIK